MQGTYTNSMDKLMTFLEESLKILDSSLNQVNFEKTLNAIWMELSAILLNFVEKSIKVTCDMTSHNISHFCSFTIFFILSLLIDLLLQKQKPPKFFSNLLSSLNFMIECFYSNFYKNQKPDFEALTKSEKLLKVNRMETSEVIQQVIFEEFDVIVN